MCSCLVDCIADGAQNPTATINSTAAAKYHSEAGQAYTKNYCSERHGVTPTSKVIKS
ncbi:hypothetical protein [Nereida ignava]|uniref:hypothetical protein n=1 Tax=Nereida ignava TaxID=282199 RepID=UPI001FD487E4|nr:hypothetical protein [Nereida ignava]